MPDQPWPKPLSPSELAHWLDVLGNYTEEAPAPAKKGSAPPKGMYVCIGCNVPSVGCIVPANVDPPPLQQSINSDRRGAENPLGHLPAAEGGPVNIKRWVEQGKCKHADKYLGQILDRLRVWSNGGISQGMIEDAVRVGRERSGFAGLHYQVGS